MIILGGTFDPPHIGHLVAAECARHQFGEEHVRLLPTGDPYRKSKDAGLQVSPAETRLDMLWLAIVGNDGLAIDEREVHREGATYTVDTLRELRDDAIDRPVMIFGADAIVDMAHWREPREIVEMSRIAIAPKVGVTLAPHEMPEGAVWLDMPAMDVSSTTIRERVRAGRPIRYLVPESVETFIREQGLYRD